MKYEKNQYSEGVSFCSLIIAGAFIFSGINSLIELSWTGIIMVLIGGSCASSQYYAYTNRSKLKDIVLNEFRTNPNTTVENIMRNTGISKKDIKAIILDLKGEGKLVGNFSSETGQLSVVKIAPENSEIPTSNQNETQNRNFCKSCGTKIDQTDAKYCQYCGSEL